jgi:hypothetical protein
MSDEFDSLDATEKAAVQGALNNAKRPSDGVVQTAPVKCRYTKSGICANIAGFCLCRQANFALPSSHDARTGKSSARRAWAGTLHQPTPNSNTQKPKARLAIDTPCYLTLDAARSRRPMPKSYRSPKNG